MYVKQKTTQYIVVARPVLGYKINTCQNARKRRDETWGGSGTVHATVTVNQLSPLLHTIVYHPLSCLRLLLNCRDLQNFGIVNKVFSKHAMSTQIQYQVAGSG